MAHELTKWASCALELLEIKLGAPLGGAQLAAVKKMVKTGPMGKAVQGWAEPAAAKLHPATSRAAQQFVQGAL